jgi:[ribosomal protein S5]-alanine N-acetyltransferase
VDSVLILRLTIDSLTGKQSSDWDKIFNPEEYNMETERLILSEISMTDLENIHELHSIPEVDEYNTLGIPQSMRETEKLIQQIIQNRGKNPRDSYTWKIGLKEADPFIGLAGLTLSNDKFKLGEIYYKLHPDYWGNGYATEIAKQLVKKGFDDFDLHKVEAGVATENLKSIRVLEKIGMTREGLRRKILPIRGEWKDNYHYAIVKMDQKNY